MRCTGPRRVRRCGWATRRAGKARTRWSPSQDEQVILLKDLCDTLTYGSLCALGGMTAFPVTSALKHFPADFGLETSEADQ